MNFTTSVFIRKNTNELLDKLEKLGYSTCLCTHIDGAVWLSTLASNGTVHGIGYSDETMPMTVEEACEMYIRESNGIDCGENENLFLAIAALKYGTDENQWFTDGKEWFLCQYPKVGMHYQDNSEILFEKWHKATVNELIKHFKYDNITNQ